MKAQITNYRQSPRKVRLVADLIRGKNVMLAKDELEHSVKRSAGIFVKLIDSAIANAKNNFKMDADNLVISGVTVDKGITLKRIRPRSKGMAHRINKRTSNIVLVLSDFSGGNNKNDKKDTNKKKVEDKQKIKKSPVNKTKKAKTAPKAVEQKK